MRRDAWAGALSWWSCQVAVARSCSLLNQPVSLEEGSNLMQNLMQICCSSHFECDGHTVHMLIQWRLPPPLTSTVKSSLSMQVLSLAASYNDVMQTILIISIMAGLFPDRPYVYWFHKLDSWKELESQNWGTTEIKRATVVTLTEVMRFNCSGMINNLFNLKMFCFV